MWLILCLLGPTCYIEICHSFMESLTSFIDLIYFIPLRGMKEDQLCWRSASKKSFAFKCYYRSLSSHTLCLLCGRLSSRQRYPFGLHFSLGLLRWGKF